MQRFQITCWNSETQKLRTSYAGEKMSYDEAMKRIYALREKNPELDYRAVPVEEKPPVELVEKYVLDHSGFPIAIVEVPRKETTLLIGSLWVQDSCNPEQFTPINQAFYKLSLAKKHHKHSFGLKNVDVKKCFITGDRLYVLPREEMYQ